MCSHRFALTRAHYPFLVYSGIRRLPVRTGRARNRCCTHRTPHVACTALSASDCLAAQKSVQPQSGWEPEPSAQKESRHNVCPMCIRVSRWQARSALFGSVVKQCLPPPQLHVTGNRLRLHPLARPMEGSSVTLRCSFLRAREVDYELIRINRRFGLCRADSGTPWAGRGERLLSTVHSPKPVTRLALFCI